MNIDAERFWALVKKTDGCWLWTGPRQRRRGYEYGLLGRILAHRASWMLHHGPIPDGLFVCHHCDNPPCVRPDHLFLGTCRDNVYDAIAKGRFRMLPPGPRGEASANHKLTDEIVVAILGSTEAAYVLAERYGVHLRTIYSVRARRIWSHIEGPVAFHGAPKKRPDPATQVRGVACHKAKLTEEKVREIRASDETLVALAKRYGVSFANISMIKRRKTWAHVL